MKQTMQVRARILRKKSTEAENHLWYFLRKRNFNGFKFRRQYVVGWYIVDFICIRKKLIIELDGGQHSQAICYDEQRTTFLESKGYIVLRFWNNEIFTEIEGVLSTILDKLKNTGQLSDFPSPCPSPTLIIRPCKKHCNVGEGTYSLNSVANVNMP